MRSTVSVVGMGIICSIGENTSVFSRSLKNGESGVSRHTQGIYSGLSMNIGAEISGFSFVDRLNGFSSLPKDTLKTAKRCAHRSPFPIQASVIAATEAWLEAKLFENTVSPERIGLVVAGENTTRHYQYGLHAQFEQNPEYLSPKYALQYLDTNQVGVLSEVFHIKGEGFVVGGASASGNVGIIKGMQMIQAGLADICVVVGVVADLSPMEMQGFINIGAMGGKTYNDLPDKASRPFDSQHEGFIYGQASACVILESIDSANRRGATVLSSLLGGSLILHATSTSEPDMEGESNAMRAALDASNVLAGEIDYLNTHGSSSPIGDQMEIKAIKNVFKDHVSQLWLNATKGLTGHCLYSAGVVELIASILQMQGEFLHPNKNLENPIDKNFLFCGEKFIDKKIITAMSNSFGFGGINTSIVFQNVR